MWIVFLHVAAMFIAFGLTAGVGIYASQVLRSGDVRTIRGAMPLAVTLTTVGAAWLVIGMLLGVGAAISFGYPLASRWLVIAYVLVAYIILDGIFVQRPHRASICRAAAASADDQPSPELRTLLEDRRAMVGGILSGIAYLGAIAMMTLKP